MTQSIHNKNKLNNKIFSDYEHPSNSIKILNKSESKTNQVAKKQLALIKNIDYPYYRSNFQKIFNFIKTIFLVAGSCINRLTIVRGAGKTWDSERLLSGKHVQFNKIGSEHLQIETKSGDRIDASYLEATNFVNKLKTDFGAQKSLFSYSFDSNLYEAEEFQCRLPSGKNIPILQLDKPDVMKEILEKFYADQNLCLLEGADGSYYVVKREDLDFLLNEHPLNEESFLPNLIIEMIDVNEKQILKENNLITKEFEGFYFDEYSEDLKETLENLGFHDCPWSLINNDGKGFLIRKNDEEIFRESGYHNIPLKISETKENDSHGKGTVLLCMNQTAIYEQHGAEFLTYALEGVNVMAYNDGGKGLSTGLTSKKHINEAVESVYQYLRHEKYVSDEMLLVKGQCFGGAPAAWLSAKHPAVNVMLDQTPANFTETAIQYKNRKLDALNEASEKSNTFIKFINQLFQSILRSALVDMVFRLLISEYKLNELIGKNKGNKLIHINVENNHGAGGDHLVPEHHPQLLIDSINDGGMLTFNPGGEHVTHWFTNNDSYNDIMYFMKKHKLITNMYEKMDI